MEIKVNEALLPFVEKSATLDNVSVDLWCERKLNGNIKRLMKDQAIGNIECAKTEDLNTYIEAVDAVKADIHLKDPIPEIKISEPTE